MKPRLTHAMTSLRWFPRNAAARWSLHGKRARRIRFIASIFICKDRRKRFSSIFERLLLVARQSVRRDGLSCRTLEPASDSPMKDAQSASPLYLKLFAETAQIEWSELQRFFARGVLLKVARDIDLVSVAEAVASDDTKQVTEWLSAGLLERVEPA